MSTRDENAEKVSKATDGRDKGEGRKDGLVGAGAVL
jgi:hypothetical protein